MTTNNGLWADLQHSLQQDLPITASLRQLLSEERTALEQRNYDHFQQLQEGKKDLLTQLEQHAQYRQQLLAQLGFDSEQATLNAAKEQAPDTGKLWVNLAEEWKQCQEMNEINERISHRTRQVVGQMLDLLRGQNGNNKTYTASGDTQNYGGGRPISSA